MLKLVLDGGTLSGPEQTLTERYLKRLGGTYKTQLVVCAKQAPAELVRQRNICLLDAAGSTKSTEAFARMIEANGSNMVFVVGGSHGPVSAWKTSTKLSLSPMTFPHRMAVAMLAEQLYRAYTLSIGHPYHH